MDPPLLPLLLVTVGDGTVGAVDGSCQRLSLRPFLLLLSVKVRSGVFPSFLFRLPFSV